MKKLVFQESKYSNKIIKGTRHNNTYAVEVMLLLFNSAIWNSIFAIYKSHPTLHISGLTTLRVRTVFFFPLG